MASLTPTPRFQFIYSNGDPLFLGKLYTYAAGTDTPLATYTTSVGNVENTNPVILDAYGSASVWLGTSLYKMVLKDENDSTIYTQDNVGGGVTLTDISGTGSGQGAALVGFIQAGTGAVARTAQAKMREFVSVLDFGAVMNGVTNDAAALQLALNTGKSVLIPNGTCLFNSSVQYTADGQSIFGLGNDSVLKQGAAAAYIETNGQDNITLSDLKIDGTGASGGIRVRLDSQNTLIENVYFKSGNQRIWLFECDFVRVIGCTFDSTGYGIITESGFASNNVHIDSNVAYGISSDFVEVNSASVLCSNWTITGNHYRQSASYPTPTTEERFVGVTEVQNVVIANNIVEKCAGDAAIHCEDLYGETIITGNIFDNCLTSGGNSGYIYLLNSAENTIVSNNVFQRSDGTLSLAYALDTSSGSYSNNIVFSNNRIVGLASGGNLSGVQIGFQTGAITIDGNCFQNLQDAIVHTGTDNVLVSSNYIKNCEAGIFLTRTSSSSGGNNWVVSGNFFQGTTGTYDLYTIQNTNGTGAPNRWTVDGNTFAKGVQISGLGGGVVGSSSDAQDISITGNVFADGATLTVSGTMSRRIRAGNIFHNVALGGGTVLYQDMQDYASDAAAAAGGIPIGGLYRNASVVQVRVT